jgi:hypothetical protein
VIPLQYIGLDGLFHLGFPTGLGLGGYSGGLDYVFLTYNTTVNIGGLTTGPTTINVPIFSFPTSISSLLSHPTFASYFAQDGVVGVLGLGENAGGPGSTTPNQYLPGDLGQGVLINEPAGTMTFGPPPTGLMQTGSVTGMPIGNIGISITGPGFSGTNYTVSATVDSGGVYGTIPSSIAPNGLYVGDVVTVYQAGTNNVLYTYTVGAGQGPSVISSGPMNTGFWAFNQHPVYIEYTASGGQTIFYS